MRQKRRLSSDIYTSHLLYKHTQIQNMIHVSYFPHPFQPKTHALCAGLCFLMAMLLVIPHITKNGQPASWIRISSSTSLDLLLVLLPLLLKVRILGSVRKRPHTLLQVLGVHLHVSISTLGTMLLLLHCYQTSRV